MERRLGIQITVTDTLQALSLKPIKIIHYLMLTEMLTEMLMIPFLL
jgi:hypothetical protein